MGFCGMSRPTVCQLCALAYSDFDQRVHWEATNKRLTETATGNYPVGVATLAAGNGVGIVRVRLDGEGTVAV